MITLPQLIHSPHHPPLSQERRPVASRAPPAGTVKPKYELLGFIMASLSSLLCFLSVLTKLNETFASVQVSIEISVHPVSICISLYKNVGILT